MRGWRCFTLILCFLSLVMAGCGGDGQESSTRTPTREKKSGAPLGLDGDTYRSLKFFKVSNLPVDDWTIIGRDNPADPERLDAEKLEIWDDTMVADGFAENVVLLRHLQQAREPLGETHLLLQPTKDNFRNTHREAIDNQMPFIYISMEGQHQVKKREADEFVDVYLDQKQTHVVESSTGTIMTKDFLTGHWLKVTQRDNRGKVAYTFFHRKKPKEIEIFRFLYWAPEDRYDEFLPVYEQIAASFELNIL